MKNTHGDHILFEYTKAADYVDSPICDACTTQMKSSAVIQNSRGETGLVTDICPNCGYIKKTRNLSTVAYGHHFSDKWLIRRKEDIVKNDFVYEKLKPYVAEKGRVLDVGCGLGGSLLAFHNPGY